MRLGLVLAACVLFSCSKKPDEIVGKDPQGNTPPTTKDKDRGGEDGAGVTVPATPVTAPISLAEATEGLAQKGTLYADIDTDLGKIECKLLDDKAPIAVANFVGLARGRQPFRDPTVKSEDRWVRRRAYTGSSFHRLIPGFMIQGGDPLGLGSGDPGYIFPDEIWPGAKHDKAGLLCMANRGPNTNGMQFFITDASAPHLDASYTIFGECSQIDIVHKIAEVPKAGEKPVTPVVIKSIKIRRI